MSSNWSTVPIIKDGTSTSNISLAIDALSARTDYLKTRIENLSGSYGTVFTDIGFASDVTLGTIIAWDGEKYVPAAAKFSDKIRPDGSLVPADTSYVVGVLISNVDTTGRATVLVQGWIKEPALIEVLTGGSSSTGAYYLSDPGKAVPGKDTDFEVPVYCFSRTSTGVLIFNPKVPEYTGHSHGSYTLASDGWEAVDKLEVPENLQNSGIQFAKYAVDNNTALGTLLRSGVSNSILTKNGEVVNAQDWAIAEDNSAIYTAFVVALNDVFVLYTISPLQGKDPIIHSLTVPKDDILLKLDNVNGNAVISTNIPESAATTADYSGTAVLSLSPQHGAVVGRVIHSIVAGPGVDITPSRDVNNNVIPGHVGISSSSIVSGQIDMQVLNLNGVLFGTDPDRVSFKFPANNESSLYGVFRIPHYDSGLRFSGKLNIILKGTGGSIAAGACTVTPIRMPKAGEPSGVVVGVPYTIPAVASSVSQQYYCAEVELEDSLIHPDTLLNCVITYSNPYEAVTVAAISLQMI